MEENPIQSVGDNDPTDELPVLSEDLVAAMEAKIPSLGDAVSSDSSEQTVELPGPATAPRADVPSETSSAPRHADANSPELGERWSAVERIMDQNATAILMLKEQLQATQQALSVSNAAQTRLLSQLGDHDAPQMPDDKLLQAELDAKSQQIAQLQAALAASEAARQAADAALTANGQTQQEQDRARSILANELAQNEAKVSELERAFESHKSERKAADTELAARARRINALESALAQSQTVATSHRQDLEASQQQLITLQQQGARDRASETQLKTQLKAATSEVQALSERLERATEERDAAVASAAPNKDSALEIATLAAHIENRNKEWHAALAQIEAHAARIAELETELRYRADRQAQLEQTARAESLLAEELRAKLSAAKLSQSPAEPAERSTSIQANHADLQQVELMAEMAELNSQLDELKHSSRAQKAALVEREQQIEALKIERDALEERLTRAEEEIARSGKDLRQIEDVIGGSVRDPASKERLSSLKEELRERIDALRKLQDSEASGAAVVDLQARRDADDRGGKPPAPPTLVCLTSDEPASYPIDRAEMIIGRGSDTDIQILTHFVSREHARLSSDSEGAVFIEDLASTNGVFVNAVRVDRQQLRHGDWVTIGETQFRFLDQSMA